MSRATAQHAKSAVAGAVRSGAEQLVAMSHLIHGTPELCFEEDRAAQWLSDALEAAGLEVERGVCDLPTAFVATAGSGPLTVGVCAEYDALPGIGHACGHNVIAAAALGAGAALARVADDLGMTVKVFGTPAEEGGGGKVLMLERGAFDGVHASLMVHPGPVEQVQLECLAVIHFTARFTGKAAHASGYPELGVNAADAITLAQVAIGLLRQHLPPACRVHGIVRKGGDAANIVPAHTEAEFFVRAPTLEELQQVDDRVRRCFEAGALATGAQLETIPLGPVYSDFTADAGMAALYKSNAEALGRTFPDTPATPMSTDMANVSRAMPAIHPMLGIDSLPAVNHQPEFAEAAVSPAADKAVVDGAVAMAWTVVDMATDDALRARLMTAG